MTEGEKTWLTFAEYIAREETSEIRHEFFEGDVFAMAGGPPEHATILGAVYLAVGGHLGAGCRAYVENLRVRVPSGKATYPDVFVVCGPLARHPEDKNTVTNPTLIIEVLSDTTEAYDRGDKFAHYRSCPSFVEYVLVSQQRPRLERFLKTNGVWTTCAAAGRGESMRLSSIDVTLDVDTIYRDLVGEDGEIRVL